MRNLIRSKFTQTTMAIASCALILTSAATALAHSYHTSNVCSTTAADICAHIGYNAEFNSAAAAAPTEFMLHFMPAAGIDAKDITNVTVSLKMDMPGHSHAGSPVTITQQNDAHYAVSDVSFSMAGQWQIKVGFDYQGTTSELTIPVDVK